MRVKKQSFIFVLIICFMAAGTAFAQLTPQGKIVGRVADAQGGALPGVSVEATSPRLVGRAATVTDADGTFRLMALPSGTYDVVFALSGFKTLTRKGVYLELSQTLTLNAVLEQAAVEEQVTVVGEAPLIDVKSTVKGQTMTREIFLSLPRGRSFDSLINTIPGVHKDTNTAGLSVDGATGPENMFYVDGADISDFHYGGDPQNIVLELLDEVRVTASGYNAEYGGSMGGVVNIITRSGSNEFHGDILGFYENNRQYMQGASRTFLRRDPYRSGYWYEYVNYDDLYYNGGKDRDRYDRYEGVISLGGYVIKDKLWFFGSFNPSYSQTSALRDFNDREGPFETFKTKNNRWGASVRVSAAPVSGLRLSASYNNSFSKYRGSIPGILGDGAENYDWALEGYDYPNQSASLTADFSAGNNLLLSYRGGWHEQDTTNEQIAPPDASYYFFGTTNSDFASDPFFVSNPDLLHTTNWASSPINQTTLYYKRGKISNNLDLTYYLKWAGEHAFKAGIGYNYLYDNRFTGAPHPCVYVYWNQTNSQLEFPVGVGADPASPYYGAYGYYFIRGSFTSDYGSVWDSSSNNLSAYLQDSWTINNKLTINLGLRAESQYMPAFTDESTWPGYGPKPIKFNMGQSLAPRLGMVYDVFGDSSLKIFGSFGIYYDIMKLYLGQLTFGGSKRVEDIYALQDPDWTKIASNGLLDDAANQEADNTFAGSMYYLPPSFDRVDPDLKPTAQREISLGVEKKLAENLSLSVRLVNKHLIRTIEDVGVFRSSGSSMYQDYWVTNPGFGVSRQISDGGLLEDTWTDPSTGLTYDLWPCTKAQREYYALNVSFEKRFSRNWQGGANWTWSRIYGNYSGLGSPDEGGRLGPGVEQDYDRWFMGYDGFGRELRGPLPQDRTHYFKAYGSYTFPFGLTVGAVAYGRTGLPMTTKLLFSSKYFYPEGRGDMGRMPFTYWADLYLDYTLKIAGKYRASINLQINNVTNTRTPQSYIMTYNRSTFSGNSYYTKILSGTFVESYKADVATLGIKHQMYGQWDSLFATWSSRLGFKFSF
jgi:Carboxypeptidase regulatory-like domain/TonB-dependent Receptor Plug Domain